jgi:hypothetical protein
MGVLPVLSAFPDADNLFAPPSLDSGAFFFYRGMYEKTFIGKRAVYRIA